MANLPRIVFIHGNETKHWAYYWAPWLKAELDKLGFETHFQTMPDSIKARKQYWLPFMEKDLAIDEHTIIIGHSSGATAAMHYAQNHKIYASILLAPCYTDMGLEEERIAGWYDDPWQWDVIKQNQHQIALLYSLDDDVIPKDEFLHIKEQINPDIIYEFTDRGHFISGKEFPEALEAIKRVIKSKNN